MSSSTQVRPPAQQASGGVVAKLAIAWTVVGVPLAYGIFETAKKASALF